MQLAKLLDAWMKLNGVSTRKLGKDLGVDYTVLHRFRKGGNASDLTLSKIIIWLLSPNSKR